MLLGLLCTVPAFAQMPPVPAELKEVDYMTGHWEGDMTMGEMKMKAKMDCDKVLGGRYIQQMHKYSGQGSPEMSGMMLLSYDENAKNWIGWWYDSTATGTLEMKGALDAGTITLTSQPTEMPGMGKVVMRSIWTKVSDTHMKLKVEMQSGTEWTTFVTADMTKK